MGSLRRTWQDVCRREAAVNPGAAAERHEEFGVWIERDENGKATSVVMAHHRAITDQGMRFVAGLPTLKRIQLWPMSDVLLQYVEPLSNLQHADFRNLSYGPHSGEDMTDAGMMSLSELHRLETLFLSEARLTGAGLYSLRGLENLKKLQLGGFFALQELKSLSSIANLVYLEAPYSLGLGYAEFCPALEEINNFDNCVTDADLAFLLGLTNLRILRIETAKVTDRGIRRLKVIRGLQELVLACPNVTEAGIKELQEALPACKIEHISESVD